MRYKLLTAVLVLGVVNLMGQVDYGSGYAVQVPSVVPDSLTLDGTADEAVWDDATTVNFGRWWQDISAAGDHALPGGSFKAKLLYAPDTVYVFAYVDKWSGNVFVPGKVDSGDQIIIGFDATHVADDSVDASYSGWNWHGPSVSPFAYQFDTTGAGNYGVGDMSPADSGWYRGSLFAAENDSGWGLELAFYVPGAAVGERIGFNIGGAMADDVTEEVIAGFAWQAVDSAGTDILSNAGGYATLDLVAETYGSGGVEYIYPVDPADLTLDGEEDEAAWDDATVINFARLWDGAWSGHPDPTGTFTAKALYAPDTVYLFVKFVDSEPLFWTPDEPWSSEMIIIGFDATHAADDSVDDSWNGWPWHGANVSPFVYQFDSSGVINYKGYASWEPEPIDSICPVDSGWYRGTLFVDELTYTWGMEMAFYVPGAAVDGQIGFNIGAGQANEEDGGYAYFSWQAVNYPGGEILSDAGGYGTLNLLPAVPVAVDDRGTDRVVPEAFALGHNYPNPFNPVTHITYKLPHDAKVELAIFNLLGQRVETLVNGRQSAGSYTITWNVSQGASGVYFYTLVADGQVVATRKMVLLR